ncbi:hypothetical protein Patl1_33514 [Pistacia atlantica]|uniref:Uncharacterized protein n=1 Tax=Pistacia atlantica TaxID=434234 RepID=A0ACC0ZTA7_9ROSI|nr:hypothetical protein Patl1_33514 [Pistacia atlantica]
MLHAAVSLRLESRRWFSIIPHQNDLLDFFDHLLQQCTKIHLLKQVHAQVIVNGSSNSAFLAARVTSVYARFGLLSDAQNVFKTTPVHCLSSSLLWNSILRVNVSNGCYENALQLNHVSWNSVVSGFALNYDCDGALDMFQRMEFEGLEPNLVTWTSLLSSHARCGRLEDTIGLFDRMRTRGIGVSAEALAVVLSACADLVAFKKGMVIHGCVLKGGFESYLFVKNALICVYGKHGDVKEAEKLFLEMKDKNIEVCEILEELARQMESEGYITDKNIIAEDVEEETMLITL